MITNINEIPNNVTGIYKINYDNQKIYIGQALNIRKRALEHNCKQKDLCDIALKKHNATIEILQEIQDISLLDEIEIIYIKKYNATDKNFGYNILSGGNVSGKRGIDNYNALFNEKTLNEVIDLLINHHELSYADIAQWYGVDKNTIYRIAQGQSYINPLLSYPLRKNNHESTKKNNIEDYFLNTDDLISLKNDLYYRWDLSIENDLCKKYNIPLKILRDINQGRKFQEIGNFSYPIRTQNVRNNNNFTQEDVLHILADLRYSKDSMTNIGNKYHINRSTVAKINKGESYIIKDYDYPARLIKL